ncbi:MAG TPA: NUDIX hydrolase [Trueperaceae bacterium]
MDFDTRVGAYAVVVRDEHILLTRLAPTEMDQGWTLPGGGLEAGEDPEGAAVREVLEETGYVVELTRLLGTSSVHIPAEQRAPGRPRRALHSLRVIYEGRVISGSLTNEVDGSTDEAGWVDVDAIPRLARVDLVDAALRLWRKQRADRVPAPKATSQT